MKTLKELAQEVYNARTTPHLLAELHIELASIYSKMNDEWVEIQLNKADFWQVKDCKYVTSYVYNVSSTGSTSDYKTDLVKREKPLSDKQVEMMWLQTLEGKEEIRKKYGLRSLEKLMQAAKSALVQSTIEARNM